jgi:hypothetical protein
MSSLWRFTERIDTQMSAHAIERALRAEWRRYVAEIAAWVPSAWEAPVLWTQYVPDLSLIEGLLGRPAPEWAREDPIRRWFADGESRSELPAHARAPIAPLLAADGGRRWRSAGSRTGAACGRVGVLSIASSSMGFAPWWRIIWRGSPRPGPKTRAGDTGSL